MQPILIRIGPVVVHSYAALIDLGLLLGALLTLREAQRREIELRSVIDAAVAAGLGGLVLARAAYAGVHWTYYGNHVHAAIRIWEGGLLWHGALVGGAVGVTVIAITRKLPLGRLFDALTPAAASLAVFAWLACLMVGCAYGVETYPGQGLLWHVSLDLPDIYGTREPRVAVQLLGAGWSAAVCCSLLMVRSRWRARGALFALWLTLISLGSYGLGFLRADQMATLADWRVDQLLSLFLCLTGLVLLLTAAISTRRDTEP